MRPSLRLAAAFGGFLFLVGCATTQSPIEVLRSEYTRRPLAALPPVPAVDVEALRAEHGQVPMVFLTHERTIEHQFALRSGVWDYVQDVRYQYVVLDPAEEQATTFRIGADRRDIIEGVRMRLVAPDGTEQLFGMDDLIREVDDDGFTYKIAYPSVQAGTVVEESFRLRRAWDRSFQPPLYHDIRLQFDVPVDQMVFRYVYPSSWQIGLKRNTANTMPVMDIDRSSHAGHTILTVERRNVRAFPDEPFSPYYKEVGAYLEFAVNKILDGDVIPVYEAPTTWEALTSDFGRYVFSRRGGATGPVAQQARTLADASAPDSVRLAAIVGWVQANIEPSDDVEGNDLQTALRTRKANIFLISGLTQAMLSEAGFDADFVLIHPASEGFFDSRFIDSHQFTEPGVLVHLEGGDRVVFPYIDGLPTTFLPDQYQGATAMKITETGLGGFVQLPSGDQAESRTEEVLDIQVDEEGVVTVREATTLRGAAAFGLRILLKDLTPEEREEQLREFVTYEEGEIQDFSFTVEGESNPAVPLVVTLAYSIQDLVTLTPEEVLFQTGGLLSPASLSSVQQAPGARQNSIRIYHDTIREKTIRVRYPMSWTLTNALGDVSESSRFGRATGQYTLEPGLLTAAQRIELRASRAPATAYSSLARLTGSESRLTIPTLVFSVGD